jgi:hypothetical protein
MGDIPAPWDDPIAWPADQLAALASVADDLAKAVEAVAMVDDVDVLIATVDRVDDVRRRASELAQACRERAAVLIGRGTHQLRDGRQVTVKGGRKRKQWDVPGLLSAVRRNALIDPDTGEVHVPTPEAQEHADRVVGAVLAVVPANPSTGFRAGALRDLRLDPDEYCESIPQPPSVQVSPKADQ